MRVIEEKVTVYPPHAICRADVPIILAALPADWSAGIRCVRLCASHKRIPQLIAYQNTFDGSLTVKSRGVSKECTLRAVLTELAGRALGLTFLGGHRLQKRDQSRVERMVEPLVEVILPQLSSKKVWLPERT